MRFAIFTHVLHTVEAGCYTAYSPYVREMNLWLRHVDEVEIVAPAPQPPKGEFIAKKTYRHSNIAFTQIPDFDLLNFRSTLKAFFKIPVIIFRITGAMNRADHLHLRCPGNIGLLACICQIFFPKKTKSAKYA
ncbi:hypothetical protein LZ575_08405 [Antarcticibacterium sp. 1MA-6-2]|uniref:hypothetical protein n=1 Tax=Antarcticibacterium sp. 1MA-6-2 TaxID=2908210 RepID=UPI001F30099A|nr:hypothetical protein [Antarcticibacterium sp. 1MA-6-2]UJH92494.1 hypothetical protein LZ575_08405 [Antarcticibacterium sp. 1MA-6-2]